MSDIIERQFTINGKGRHSEIVHVRGVLRCPEIVILEKDEGPLTKKVHLSPDGKLLNDSRDCRMSRGMMTRRRLLDWTELARIIEATPRNVAYSLGALRTGIPDPVRLAVKADPLSTQPGYATRTGGTIIYREDWPAFVLLDFDTKGMPAAVKERIAACGGFAGALAALCSGFETLLNPAPVHHREHRQHGDRRPISVRWRALLRPGQGRCRREEVPLYIARSMLGQWLRLVHCRQGWSIARALAH